MLYGNIELEFVPSPDGLCTGCYFANRNCGGIDCHPQGQHPMICKEVKPQVGDKYLSQLSHALVMYWGYRDGRYIYAVLRGSFKSPSGFVTRTSPIIAKFKLED